MSGLSKVVPCDMLREEAQPDLEALIAFYVTTQGKDWSNRDGWMREEELQ